MLNIKNISIKYGKNTIIDNFSYKFKKGNITAIIGPNGTGKSSLTKAIVNSIPFSGEVTYDNKIIKSLKRFEVAKIIGILTQSQTVYFPFTVFDTVMVGRYAYSKDKLNTKSIGDTELVNKALEKVDMLKYKDRLINELSGGQKQRVYLARLIVQNPEVVILDEPTNNLDFKYQVELLEFIKSWAKEENKIIIMVMHDLNLVKKYSHEVIIMTEEKKCIIGKKNDVLSKQNLFNVFGIDVEDYMKNILTLWK